MPTKLGLPYTTMWRGKYPHMLAEDRPIWELYITRHVNDFIELYYDVRVGGIVSTDPEASEAMREMYFSVSAKRLDVLAVRPNEVWIIEVAAAPGLRATGQLMTYLALWHDDPKINKPAVGVLLAKVIDADLRRALEIYGMRPLLADTD